MTTDVYTPASGPYDYVFQMGGRGAFDEEAEELRYSVAMLKRVIATGDIVSTESVAKVIISTDLTVIVDGEEITDPAVTFTSWWTTSAMGTPAAGVASILATVRAAVVAARGL